MPNPQRSVVDVRGVAHALDTRSAALVWSRCADVQRLADASGLARSVVGGPPGGSIRLTVLIVAQSAAAGAQALAQLDRIDIGLVRKAACKPRGSPGRQDG